MTIAQEPLLTPWGILTATALPLALDNIDTDQIIPARFLKITTRDGLGDACFADLRNDANGKPRADFAGNDPRYAGAQVLVARDNFGCGSSREHAPWALRAMGFKAIVATSFADIFNNNALKNGLLPIVLPATVVANLLKALPNNPTATIMVDLAHQTITFAPELGVSTQSFAIDPFRKACLLNGVDDIGFSLTYSNAVQAFETDYEIQWPAPTTTPQLLAESKA
jgi:3-isopropylmalate/(R)-2-methylmalate dehydratase small subunit